MDEPPSILDPPEPRRCVVCGDRRAAFGFGPPGFPLQPTEAWYCGAHRGEGERLWTARYRGGTLGPAVLL